MTDTITFRGKEYPVSEEIPDIAMITISHFISNPGRFDAITEAAQTVQEVIVPGIEGLTRILPSSGKYYFNNSKDVVEVFAQISKIVSNRASKGELNE